MESRFLLDVVVTQGTSIFQLFTSENETLLIWWDTFFILDLSFDIVIIGERLLRRNTVFKF